MILPCRLEEMSDPLQVIRDAVAEAPEAEMPGTRLLLEAYGEKKAQTGKVSRGQKRKEIATLAYQCKRAWKKERHLLTLPKVLCKIVDIQLSRQVVAQGECERCVFTIVIIIILKGG